jgi:hypothetical protein
MNNVCFYVSVKNTNFTVSKLKRPPTEWKKILAGYTLDKGLITRIYRSSKN